MHFDLATAVIFLAVGLAVGAGLAKFDIFRGKTGR